MYQNLMNAEFVFVESLTAENITLHVIRIIQALTKGVPASAGMLLLHIYVPSIASFT